MLLYYQYYYSFSFIYYFIIPLFCYKRFNCFKLAFACYHLASFLLLGYFAAYFQQFFIFISFLYHPFIRRCFVQSQFIHIFCNTFYAVFICSYWLSMIQCHFIVLTIILKTYSWQPFLSSNFIVFLVVLLSFYL